MHDVVSFGLTAFILFGAYTLFGITGFVIGPLVAALFMASWDIFARGQNE